MYVCVYGCQLKCMTVCTRELNCWHIAVFLGSGSSIFGSSDDVVYICLQCSVCMYSIIVGFIQCNVLGH